jgi:hypothetical protein
MKPNACGGGNALSMKEYYVPVTIKEAEFSG